MKLCALVITLLITATNSSAQSFTLDSFAKAKSVLDRSVEAYGGTTSLNTIKNVSIKIEAWGRMSHAVQD